MTLLAQEFAQCVSGAAQPAGLWVSPYRNGIERFSSGEDFFDNSGGLFMDGENSDPHTSLYSAFKQSESISGTNLLSFFILALPSFGAHPRSVELREVDERPERMESVFSTQNDPSLRAYNNRRARGDGTVVWDKGQFAPLSCRPHDRDPGPGLLAFSRSPVSDPLFYKRNSNPQNGGNA